MSFRKSTMSHQNPDQAIKRKKEVITAEKIAPNGNRMSSATKDQKDR